MSTSTPMPTQQPDQRRWRAHPTPAASLIGWAPELRKAKVYEQMLLDLLLGILPPGGRLDERDLTLRYDAGLAGVRDALGRLALEGLVIRRPRSGTTVAPLDLADVRQDYEVRKLVEPHGAYLAAQNAGRDDVEALRRAFEGAEDAAGAGDLQTLVAMDQRFHAALARATGNLALAKIILPLQHKATRFWVRSVQDDSAEARMAEVERHRALGECIARGDAEAARAAMQDVLGGFLTGRLAPSR